jgi:hypothetical protein
MRIVRCSASSIGTYNRCQFSYFMHYSLGMETKVGKAAIQGSIVHKTLEWMLKLRKRGKTNVDPMWLLDRAWDELTQASPEIEIRRVTTRIDRETGELKEAVDFKKCRVALETIIADKFYNPYNLKILDVEQWFELMMPGKEWECVDQDGISHQFATRGFIDLVHEIDSDTIEIVDWKSGNRANFHTQEQIDEAVLTREVQPRLYHLAAFFLYPQYKNILITFYYANSGGPVTISLSHDDLTATIAYLYDFMTKVKEDTLIHRNLHWSCKLCSFRNNGICDRIWSDLCTMGGEYIKDRYTKLNYEQQLAIGKPYG